MDDYKISVHEFDTNVYTYFCGNFQNIEYDGKEEKYKGTVLITKEDMRYYLLHHVGKYFVATQKEQFGTFEYIWHDYLTTHKHMLYNSYDVLMLEYNPIENYRRNEEHNYSAYTDTSSVNQGQRESTSTDTLSPVGYNSESYSNGGKSTNDTVAKEVTDNVTDEHGERTENTLVYGNIGVMTSQSMVESELRLKQYNLVAWFINTFVNENLFYC